MFRVSWGGVIGGIGGLKTVCVNCAMTRGLVGSRLIDKRVGINDRINLGVSRALARSTANAVTCLRFRTVNVGEIGARLSITCISRGALRAKFRGTSSRHFVNDITGGHKVEFSHPKGNVYRRMRLRHFNGPKGALVNSSDRAPANNNVNVLTVNTNKLSMTITVNNNACCVAVPGVIGMRLAKGLDPCIATGSMVLRILEEVAIGNNMNGVVRCANRNIGSLSIPRETAVAGVNTRLKTAASIFPSSRVAGTFLRTRNEISS